MVCMVKVADREKPKTRFYKIIYILAGIIFLMGVFMNNNLLARSDKRPRAREARVVIGVISPGKYNAITDVKGVKVGHVTIIKGDSVRTGVTAVLPHSGNIFKEKVSGAVYVGNGFGKLAGSTQIEELGNIETPIILTNTLSVGTAVTAVVKYTLSLPGNEEVRSVNAVVGETNDGWLNDIRGFHVEEDDVLQAIQNAKEGSVEEGCIGAGTGTICLGFKGGIGTASRVLPDTLGGWTVGVLVQTNFGGILSVNGAPVGRELKRYSFSRYLPDDEEGSCMIVVATDAPLLHRNLRRLASRAMLGLGLSGGFSSNGSGDYVIAFSTNKHCRIASDELNKEIIFHEVPNNRMSPLFLAVVEATYEAVINSLFAARTTKGRDGHVAQALPVKKVIGICRKYNSLNWDKTLLKKELR